MTACLLYFDGELLTFNGEPLSFGDCGDEVGYLGVVPMSAGGGKPSVDRRRRVTRSTRSEVRMSSRRQIRKL